MMISPVQSRIAEIRQATDRKVSLIGWSFGGLYARLAAQIGLGFNPSVLWAIADRLALQEGEFKPFGRRGPVRFGYAAPEHGEPDGRP